MRLAILPRCPVERFVALAPAAEARLVVAELTGDALVLGRHQRRSSALADAPLPVVRRRGGGRTLRAGDGVVGVQLSLPAPGVPLDRVINRQVRPIRAALGTAYFGRDWLSRAQAQVGMVSLDATEEGSVVFEAWLAATHTLALDAAWSRYPTHGDPRAAGAPHGILDRSFDDVAARLASAFGASGDAAVEDGAPLTVDEDERGLGWSGVADVPIGFVEALARLDGGVFAEVRLRGDFIAPAWWIAHLERALRGVAPSLPAAGAVVRDALAWPGFFLHGVVDAGVFAQAACAAVTT